MPPPSALRSPAALGLALAGARVGMGVVMLVRPTWVTRLLGLDQATAKRTGWLPRMLGGREMALGIGALAAVRAQREAPDRGSARAWLLAGALTDATDLFAISAGMRGKNLPRAIGGLACLTSASAAVVGVAAAVDRRPVH